MKTILGRVVILLCLSSAFVFGIRVVGQEGTPQARQTQSAKQSDTGVAKVPFEFMTFEKKMPAGEYEISSMGPTHLYIRNTNDKNYAIELFTMPDKHELIAKKDAALIFIERDGTHYLVGITNPDGRQRITGLYGRTPKDTDIRKEVPIVYE